jgi:hypothetical protein
MARRVTSPAPTATPRSSPYGYGLNDIELIEPIGPIDFVLFVGNVNALPSVAREIGGLEYGS